jgi:hypothetical protein
MIELVEPLASCALPSNNDHPGEVRWVRWAIPFSRQIFHLAPSFSPEGKRSLIKTFS